jgi:hypothetical protein
MTVAGPGGPGAAQKVFENPQNRDQLLEMHRAGTPFLEMATQVGVEISTEYAQLIRGLSAKDVDVIRRAMVAALEASRTEMPYDCTLKTIPQSLDVTGTETDKGYWATVTPAK